ncbi:MAG: YafY family protein [Polyangiaceae bacterium]
MSRAARLLDLLQVLRRRRAPVTGRQLAEELEISRRSLYRDIQTLRGQGALIEGEAGVGYVLRPGFLLPPLMFDEDELEAIVLGLRLAHEHGDAALGRAAVGASTKIQAVLPKRLLLEDAPLLAGPRPDRPADTIDLAEVRRAMRDQRKASIEYVDPSGRVTSRIIWPLALAFFDRARLVVAWCEMRTDFRSFRSDRIRKWAVQETPMPRSRAALLKEWRRQTGVPEPELP